jgi:hypothetical protein
MLSKFMDGQLTNPTTIFVHVCNSYIECLIFQDAILGRYCLASSLNITKDFPHDVKQFIFPCYLKAVQSMLRLP